MNTMGGFRTRVSEDSQAPRRRSNLNLPPQEHQLLVVEKPRVTGPFAVDDNPLEVQYKLVARLALPSKDADVTPSISVGDMSARGTFLDVQWTTGDSREPSGVWERSVTITLPRQFAVAGCAVTGEAPLVEHEVGA